MNTLIVPAGHKLFAVGASIVYWLSDNRFTVRASANFVVAVDSASAALAFRTALARDLPRLFPEYARLTPQIEVMATESVNRFVWEDQE